MHFYKTLNFMLGGAYDMQYESCLAQWDLYVYQVSYLYVQVGMRYAAQ